MEKKYFANLECREVNGVFIPDIELPENKAIGRFGWQHEAWLKKNRRCRYSLLIGSGEIIDYLARVDAEANEMYESLIADFSKMEDYRNQLLDNLTVEQKHLWEEYERYANTLTSQTECEIFIDGFRLGMRLALELFE